VEITIMKDIMRICIFSSCLLNKNLIDKDFVFILPTLDFLLNQIFLKV
jgi:hypothetical protein